MAKVVRFTANNGRVTEFALKDGRLVVPGMVGGRWDLVDLSTGRAIPGAKFLQQGRSVVLKFAEKGKLDTRNNRDFGGAMIQFVGAG